jgi:hypothetical protein
MSVLNCLIEDWRSKWTHATDPQVPNALELIKRVEGGTNSDVSRELIKEKPLIESNPLPNSKTRQSNSLIPS